MPYPDETPSKTLPERPYRISGHWGPPRGRGGPPSSFMVACHHWMSAPPARVEGRTFEFSFPLPGSAQRKRNPSKVAGPGKNAAPKTRKDQKAGASGSPKPKSSVHQLNGDNTHQETPSAKANGTRQDRREYEQARNKTPERMEYNRRLAQEQRQKARELGQCRNCSEPAILSQTRCPTCAEHHRQSRRRSDARRRDAAKRAATTDRAGQ